MITNLIYIYIYEDDEDDEDEDGIFHYKDYTE